MKGFVEFIIFSIDQVEVEILEELLLENSNDTIYEDEISEIKRPILDLIALKTN